MPIITPSLVPTVPPGSLFDRLSSDASIGIRFLTAVDPVYFEIYNRPIADVAFQNLVIAKTLDQISVRLGHQQLYPFIIQPRVIGAITTVDIPLTMIWDMHVSIDQRWEKVRLARIKRVSGSNTGSDPTFTGKLRLVFTATDTGTAAMPEQALFQADIDIDSDLLYQIVRIDQPTDEPSADPAEEDSIAGFVIFRTLDQDDNTAITFLNNVAPPSFSPIIDDEFDPPAIYQIANTTMGGAVNPDDFDEMVVSHGTGVLLASATNALPAMATGNFVPESQKGQPNGVATLDATADVPASQLGNVASIETDPVFLAQKGQPSGVATLDGSSNVPAIQLGNVPVTNVPTTGQKQALVGTFGAPGSSNRYVTETDSRVTGLGLFQCRMQVDAVNQISLRQYAGPLIEVRGEIITVSTSGFIRGIGDNLITSTGADSGGTPPSNAQYHVYVSNSSASFSPTSIRLSTVSYTADTNGVRYLGTSGNASNWRWVGMVFVDITNIFVDDETRRYIVNYYNRRRKVGIARPGYSNDNAETTFTHTNTSYAVANGGVGARVSFLALDGDHIQLQASMDSHSTTSADLSALGIGIDSTTSASFAARFAHNDNGIRRSVTVNGALITSGDGVRSADMLIMTSAGTLTVFADAARNGSTADPPSTFLMVWIDA